MRKKLRKITIENIADYDLPVSQITKMADWILSADDSISSWDVTFVFVDNEFITEQNGRFFEKQTPTDVISFNLSDAADKLEGEVYISVEMAQLNAQDYDVSLENELLRLVAHGSYHLLDFDDKTPEQKQHMTALENRALDFIYSYFNSDSEG